jgi:hypothetical protein
VVSGQYPDAGGDQRHEQDPGSQRPPAPQPVAPVGKEQGAGRAGQEGDAEDREGGEEPGARVASGEERGGDDRGERAVEREVVPLDEVADAAGDQGASPGRPGRPLLDPFGFAVDGGALGLLHTPPVRPSAVRADGRAPPART